MQFLYETHLHTSQASACSISTGAEQARAYSKMGYSGIIVTDHFFNGNSAVPRGLPWRERVGLFVSGYMDAKETGEEIGLNVFFGWEYNIRGQEFLTYGLDFDFLISHTELENMNAKDYSALVRSNGGYLAQAHPFRAGRRGPVDASLMDGVEVINAANKEEENEKAKIFADRNALPVQAGTDSHYEFNYQVSGIILNKRAESIFDIIHAIKNFETELVIP